MVGRAAANCANIGITVAGANRKSDIVVYEDSNAKLTATGAYSHDGFPQDVYADITPTTATLYVNGVLVASTTFASVNWSNVAASNYVGALNASGNNRWPGALWNARFIDHMTATNCVWLNMDEPPSLSASYANAYTVPTDPLYNVGTTTPTSANKGTVAAMPWVCAVDSMDGRGMPFQPVGPLIYHAQQGSTQALDGGVAAFTSLQFTGAETDPTGSFTLSNATFFTAPYAGLAVVTLCGGFDGNADVADPITIELRNSGSTFYALQTEGGVLAVPVTYSLRGVSAMTVGQTLGALVNGAAATTTLTLRGHAVTIEFYPTPTTG